MTRERVTLDGFAASIDRSLKSEDGVHRGKVKKSLTTQPHRRKNAGDSASFFGVERHIVCPAERGISPWQASRVPFSGRTWEHKRMTGSSEPRSMADNRRGERAVPFDGFYTQNQRVSNGEPHEGSGEFTCFTDFTPNRKGGYVTPARTHSRPRSRAHPPTPPTKPVKPVKSVKSQDGRGRFSPPGCKIGCKFYTQPGLGVVA